MSDKSRDAWIESRAFAAAVLAVLLLSWWWIAAMARDMYGPMNGPSAWMMTDVWDARHLLLLWTMWAVMMAAMMVPSAWPMLKMYGTIAANQPSPNASQIYLFLAGYLVVWTGFSLGATVLQRLLAHLLLLSPMMELVSPRAGALVLAAAGIYQVTPLKRMCLGACRTPVAFIVRHWHSGARGAFQMGATHGLYCVGCCWALMLLLFVGGVMNLYVIAALAVMVTLEKVAHAGEWGSRLSGALLIALAVWMAGR